MQDGLLSRIGEALAAKQATLRQWFDSADQEEVRAALGPSGEAPFREHMHLLDTARGQAEDGSLGICTVCHEPVEDELILMDYTSCVCLSHLSEAEQRSLESELELAQTVQQSLLPQHPPDVPGLEVAAYSRPAQVVGGDYFDFFPFKDGRQGIVISDVAGHGMSSSLIMASLQTMLRTLSMDSDHPADLVTRINQLCLHNIQFTTFISLFLSAFDPKTRTFTYCNAGHNPPLLIRRDAARTVEWLEPSGAAVGLVEGSVYRDRSISMAPGDLVFLYTDGVTEANNVQGDLFGARRMAGVISEHRDLPAQDLLHAMRDQLGAFTGGGPPSDDVTMVAFRVTS